MKKQHKVPTASDPEKGCPVPATHRRLHDGHQNWHETCIKYSDPEGFRIALNATIQTLRNVTWILQSELKHSAGFDAWYATWQDKMKNDKRMRWLVEARNKLVKQGDLQTHSLAKAMLMTD